MPTLLPEPLASAPFIVLRAVLFVLFLNAAGFGIELKVGTLNCYLLFDPSYDHPGRIDEQNPLSPENYQRKVSNLATLINGYEVVGLQEIGGRPEVEMFAKTAGMKWAFAKGKDTATGQEVALLHRLSGWQMIRHGRVPQLDRHLSKHLSVSMEKGSSRIHFLVVHLIRPIGKQAEKHAEQLRAVGNWMRNQVGQDPNATVIVLGDTNNSTKASLWGFGQEAAELNGYKETHLIRQPYDRLIVAGIGRWTAIEIRRPPYGTRPNDLNKSLWTDHFFIGATLQIPRSN